MNERNCQVEIDSVSCAEEIEADTYGYKIFLEVMNTIDDVLLMLNLPFPRQAYKVYQEPGFCVRQYSCRFINAVCNFSLRSASRVAVLP